MYIVDLLEYLKVRNQTSWMEALSIIETIKLFGPKVAKAEMLGETVCVGRTHIGYGLEVVIEMDRDRAGEWTPVFGQIEKR